jgi:hypothetical protein
VTSVEPCDKHDLINCSICHHPPPAPKFKVSGGTGKFRAGLRSISDDRHWVKARFDGYCYECHTPIEEGDLITRSQDDEGWVCEDCA